MKGISTVVFLFIMVVESLKKESSGSTLKLLQVFHRHGARTPEQVAIYPTDPYKQQDFLPMGYGQLTNAGKRQMYKLGRMLRQRYGSFLGDVYTPDDLYAHSTDYDRTRASLLVLLAALFKPAPSQMFEADVAWQPVDINFTADAYDYVFRRPIFFCPTYRKELDRILKSDKAQNFWKQHKTTIDHVEEHSGLHLNTLWDAFCIWQTLTAERTMNLSLPQWTESVFPEELLRLANKQCELENYNSLLRRLGGGRLLQTVVNNIVAKANGTLRPVGRKIFILSGHDFNVYNILAAMNLFKPHIPTYASAVIIELHYLKEKQEYAVKVFYLKDVDKEPEAKRLEGCDLLCPLQKFIQITKSQVPDNYTAECDSAINLD